MALLNAAWGERSGKLMTRRFDCASLCEKAPWTAKNPPMASTAARIRTRRFIRTLLKKPNTDIRIGHEFSLPDKQTARVENAIGKEEARGGQGLGSSLAAGGRPASAGAGAGAGGCG